MLEIAISGTDRLVLTKSNLFNDNDIIDFSVLLTYGKIKKIETKEHKKVSLNEFSPKEEYNKLAEKIANYDEIRIWYSSGDSEDLNTYYYLVNYLSNKNKIIYSCDVCNGCNFSLGCYTSDEIENLLLNTKKLTQEEIVNLSLIWKQLEEENADLRLIEDDKLISHNFNFLDNKILEKLSAYKEPVRYYSFVGNLMSNKIYGLCSDLFFSARIDYLIEIGKILIFEIIKEKNIIGELADYKYIKIKLYKKYGERMQTMFAICLQKMKNT